MNIIFMGTPKFSIPILESLARQGNAIVGVVTRPDKPSGRGRNIPTEARYICGRRLRGNSAPIIVR